MNTRRKVRALGLIAASLFPIAAMAQDSDLQARMKAMEDRIISLEAEVRSLKAQQPVAAVQPAPAQAAPTAAVAQAPTPEPSPAQVTLGGAG